MTLDDDEIRARTARHFHGLYRPLDEIAATVPTVAGLSTGLDAIDRMTGGLRPRKLNLVVGFSSHGKTALMLSIIVRNLDKRCLFISADDTDDILLMKLLAMHLGCSVADVEAAGPAWRINAAREHFPNLAIAVPQESNSYSVDQLKQLYHMVSVQMGAPVELVGFDYLSLLTLRQGEVENGALATRQKAIEIKQLIRETPDAVWMVGQQCNRGAGSNCPALLMTHVEFGGIQETDGVMIGCRRRVDTTQMSDHQLWEESIAPTTNISVMKNKVTGVKSENPVGIPYLIDPVSGLIRPMLDSDKPTKVPALKFPSPVRTYETNGSH